MNILSKINAKALNDPELLIADSEKRYDAELNFLVDKVSVNSAYKILLIAGPSGSGKTTTAHILKSKFAAIGKKAEVLSLDHFFLPLDRMPLQENGEKDFESVHSLDIPEIHKCFDQLITNAVAEIPIFDFLAGGRIKTKRKIDISNGGILIVEGLHALNPILTDELDATGVFKIYISVNTSVVDDNGNKLLSSRQMRLIRRMSRDHIYRNTDAAGTLKLWTSVVRGEEKYLYCFKDIADYKLVTFHSYEPCIFKDIILDLLKNLPKTVDNYDYIMSVKSVLERFVSLNLNLVPETSLIREFIPGGAFENHK